MYERAQVPAGHPRPGPPLVEKVADRKGATRRPTAVAPAHAGLGAQDDRRVTVDLHFEVVEREVADDLVVFAMEDLDLRSFGRRVDDVALEGRTIDAVEHFAVDRVKCVHEGLTRAAVESGGVHHLATGDGRVCVSRRTGAFDGHHVSG